MDQQCGDFSLSLSLFQAAFSHKMDKGPKFARNVQQWNILMITSRVSQRYRKLILDAYFFDPFRMNIEER